MSQRFNFAMTLVYDGTPFLGWQQTNEGPSIKEELHKALKITLKEAVEINGASRTDAGVHSLGQLVNFYTSKQPDLFSLKKSLNALLPIAIKVTEIQEVPGSFHATLDNTGKEYHYWLTFFPAQFPHKRHTMWHIPGKLEIDRMKQAAALLQGTHDFKAFCNVKKDDEYASTIRTVDSIEIIEHPTETLQIIILGNNFLYKMVRNIVGTLVHIGKGRLSEKEVLNLLDKKDRKLIGQTAPAHGLTLFRVFGNPMEKIHHTKSNEKKGY